MLDRSKLVSKSDSLKDIAIRQRGSWYDDINSGGPSREKSIIFLGSKGVGKTSLIHRFLDRDEVPKPTLALDYTYGRKSAKSLVKDVCHIWELGGGTVHVPLLDPTLAYLGPGGIHDMTVVLMLELSAPQYLWYTMETLLHELYVAIRRHAGSNMEKLQNLAWSRLGQDHPDRDFLDPFPVPLIILGAKYDVFQEFDPENKKAVCRCLRYVAHTLGAALLFYSIKEPGLVKRAKDLFAYHGFSTAAIKSISTDYNKPLIIPAGCDSMQQIGSVVAPVRSKPVSHSGPGAALEQWKHLFTTHFRQEISERNALPEDPGRDLNYSEPLIDDLRVQKDDELELYRKQVNHHEKLRDTNLAE